MKRVHLLCFILLMALMVVGVGCLVVSWMGKAQPPGAADQGWLRQEKSYRSEDEKEGLVTAYLRRAVVDYVMSSDLPDFRVAQLMESDDGTDPLTRRYDVWMEFDRDVLENWPKYALGHGISDTDERSRQVHFIWGYLCVCAGREGMAYDEFHYHEFLALALRHLDDAGVGVPVGKGGNPAGPGKFLASYGDFPAHAAGEVAELTPPVQGDVPENTEFFARIVGEAERRVSLRKLLLGYGKFRPPGVGRDLVESMLKESQAWAVCLAAVERGGWKKAEREWVSRQIRFKGDTVGMDSAGAAEFMYQWFMEHRAETPQEISEWRDRR